MHDKQFEGEMVFYCCKKVELNPFWRQKKLREFCKEKGIHITAYSPLGANGTRWGDNRIVGCDVLNEIAKAKGKTTAQVFPLKCLPYAIYVCSNTISLDCLVQ